MPEQPAAYLRGSVETEIAADAVSAADSSAAWEYGVRYVNDPESWEPHRSGMSEEDARDWVGDFEADGGKPGAFIVVRRQIGAWEDA